MERVKDEEATAVAEKMLEGTSLKVPSAIHTLPDLPNLCEQIHRSFLTPPLHFSSPLSLIPFLFSLLLSSLLLSKEQARMLRCRQAHEKHERGATDGLEMERGKAHECQGGGGGVGGGEEGEITTRLIEYLKGDLLRLQAKRGEGRGKNVCGRSTTDMDEEDSLQLLAAYGVSMHVIIPLRITGI